MKTLVSYWQDQFDWRAREAELNAFPQFVVKMPDVDLHFLHVPGQGPSPTPLLLMHGWPGSVFEFVDIIPRLTDPARFGGDPADAFYRDRAFASRVMGCRSNPDRSDSASRISPPALRR